MKKCPQCDGEKPLDAFAVDRSKKDGRKARCKDCLARQAREKYSSAERSKAYYKASPEARAKRTVDRRNSRWKGLAAQYGEHWLIKEVQNLKAGGALSWEAIARAEDDKRLAVLFRGATKTSNEALRAAFGPTWDQVRGMPLTRAEYVSRAMRYHARAAGAAAARLRAGYEKRWIEWGIQPMRDESDDAPEICQNALPRREQRRAASDRILRK